MTQIIRSDGTIDLEVLSAEGVGVEFAVGAKLPSGKHVIFVFEVGTDGALIVKRGPELIEVQLAPGDIRELSIAPDAYAINGSIRRGQQLSFCDLASGTRVVIGEVFHFSRCAKYK